MKKLIAISVVFALVAGVAFAVDLGGSVIGTVNVIEGNTGKDAAGDSNPVGASGGFNQLRLEGAGEAGDGKYGGWIRLGDGKSPGFSGLAWWKPIDQLKVTIGNNPDGRWDKDGVSGWMFYQGATDVGVTMQGGNVWGGTYTGIDLNMRKAFYGGFGADALMLEIKPLDMIGINIGIPVFAGGTAGDVFSQINAQVDLNFSFGNIALTYKGGKGYKERVAPTAVWVEDNTLIRNPSAPTGGWEWGIVNSAGIFTPDPDNKPPALPEGTGAGTLGAGNKVEVRWNPALKAGKPYEDTTGWKKTDGTAESSDPSSFYLSFSLKAIENLGLDFGIGYTLPSKETCYTTTNVAGEIVVTPEANGSYKSYTVTHSNPIAIGLGAKYAMGAFAVKLRTVLAFGGGNVADGAKPYYDYSGYTLADAAVNKDVSTDKEDGRFKMLFDILPYYALNDSFRIYLSAGIGLESATKSEAGLIDFYKSVPVYGKELVKTQVAWHVNPYVEIGEEWGARFFAGFKIWSSGQGILTDKDDKAVVNFAVPIALVVSF